MRCLLVLQIENQSFEVSSSDKSLCRHIASYTYMISQMQNDTSNGQKVCRK